MNLSIMRKLVTAREDFEARHWATQCYLEDLETLKSGDKQKIADVVQLARLVSRICLEKLPDKADQIISDVQTLPCNEFFPTWNEKIMGRLHTMLNEGGAVGRFTTDHDFRIVRLGPTPFEAGYFNKLFVSAEYYENILKYASNADSEVDPEIVEAQAEEKALRVVRQISLSTLVREGKQILPFPEGEGSALAARIEKILYNYFQFDAIWATVKEDENKRWVLIEDGSHGSSYGQGWENWQVRPAVGRL